jgi:hypothetical protein
MDDQGQAPSAPVFLFRLFLLLSQYALGDIALHPSSPCGIPGKIGCGPLAKCEPPLALYTALASSGSGWETHGYGVASDARDGAKICLEVFTRTPSGRVPRLRLRTLQGSTSSKCRDPKTEVALAALPPRWCGGQAFSHHAFPATRAAIGPVLVGRFSFPVCLTVVARQAMQTRLPHGV